MVVRYEHWDSGDNGGDDEKKRKRWRWWWLDLRQTVVRFEVEDG